MNILKKLLIRLLDLSGNKGTSGTMTSQVSMMPGLNTVPLEVPACWRRSAQIHIDNRRRLNRS